MKIKGVDLGPRIPVAIQSVRFYPHKLEGLDIFSGWRISKSFVIFRNPCWWAIANGHGLVAWMDEYTLKQIYEIVGELETLPIDWSQVTTFVRLDPSLDRAISAILSQFTKRVRR